MPLLAMAIAGRARADGRSPPLLLPPTVIALGPQGTAWASKGRRGAGEWLRKSWMACRAPVLVSPDGVTLSMGKKGRDKETCPLYQCPLLARREQCPVRNQHRSHEHLSDNITPDVG